MLILWHGRKKNYSDFYFIIDYLIIRDLQSNITLLIAIVLFWWRICLKESNKFVNKQFSWKQRKHVKLFNFLNLSSLLPYKLLFKIDTSTKLMMNLIPLNLWHKTTNKVLERPLDCNDHPHWIGSCPTDAHSKNSNDSPRSTVIVEVIPVSQLSENKKTSKV